MLRSIACIALLNAIWIGVIAVVFFVSEQLQLKEVYGYVAAATYFPVAIGTLICIFFVAPFHWYEHFQTRKLKSTIGPDRYPTMLKCPMTGARTSNLKQMNVPSQILFLGILAAARSEEVVACPTAMRKHIRNTFLWNLPLGNVLTLVLLPTYIVLYCLTYTKGHSARLYHPERGALAGKPSAAAAATTKARTTPSSEKPAAAPAVRYEGDFTSRCLGSMLITLVVGAAVFSGLRVSISETEGFRALFVAVCPVIGAFVAYAMAAFLKRRSAPGSLVRFVIPWTAFLLFGIAPWVMMLRRIDEMGF